MPAPHRMQTLWPWCENIPKMPKQMQKHNQLLSPLQICEKKTTTGKQRVSDFDFLLQCHDDSTTNERMSQQPPAHRQMQMN